MPVVVPLGPAQEIDELVLGVQQHLSQIAADPGQSARWAENVYRRISDNLRRVIWSPPGVVPQGLETIFVVPDGTLNLVSLAALPASPSRYLIESGPRIHYLSAERDLLLEVRAPMAEGMLALGDPDFDEPAFFAALVPGSEMVVATCPQRSRIK